MANRKEFPFYLYRIDCENNVIYIGISSYLELRLEQHFSGNGSYITKQFKPISFDVLGEFPSKFSALRAEMEMVIKLRNMGHDVYGSKWCTYPFNGTFLTNREISSLHRKLDWECRKRIERD